MHWTDVVFVFHLFLHKMKDMLIDISIEYLSCKILCGATNKIYLCLRVSFRSVTSIVGKCIVDFFE